MGFHGFSGRRRPANCAFRGRDKNFGIRAGMEGVFDDLQGVLKGQLFVNPIDLKRCKILKGLRYSKISH